MNHNRLILHREKKNMGDGRTCKRQNDFPAQSACAEREGASMFGSWGLVDGTRGGGVNMFSNHESRLFSAPKGTLNINPSAPPTVLLPPPPAAPPPPPPLLLSLSPALFSPSPHAKELTMKRCDYHRSVQTEPVSSASELQPAWRGGGGGGATGPGPHHPALAPA